MSTMAKRCYYEVLGVERSAAAGEISSAYRKLAVKYHPDKNPGDTDAIARFKEAAEAFEILSDQNKRARYDRYGHAGVEGGAGRFTDVNDIFSAFGDIFGEGFGDLFGGGGRRRRPSKGADVRCDVRLTLMEAARGVTKTIEFERHEFCETCEGTGAKPGTKRETCSYCAGRGQVVQATGIFRVQTTCPACRGAGSMVKQPCGDCRGDGVTVARVRREVQIPAGIDDQMRVRLAGEGEPSAEGGARGDCYCFVTVQEHPLFQREGQHLIVRVPITYPQAALGATLEVPTLDGPEQLTIPAGSQPGDMFKLRHRGLPHPRHRNVGDLIVVVDLEVPKQLSEKQQKLLRELSELDQKHVSEERKSFFQKLKDYIVPDEETPAQ
jgi:molecular chaperone DnaJ